MHSDYFSRFDIFLLQHLNLFPLVPLTLFICLLLYSRLSRVALNLRGALVLSVSLPLALMYTLALGGAINGVTSSFLDQLHDRIAKILIFAPQVLVLYPIGIGHWIHFLRSGNAAPDLWRLTLLTAFLGHLLTRHLFTGTSL